MKLNAIYIAIILILGGITLGTVYAANTVVPFTPDYQLQDTVNNNIIRFDVNNAGNIGIGTTNPNERLEIDTSGSYGPVIKLTDLNTGYSYGIAANSNSAFRIHNFNTGLDPLYITSNGNIGMGTTSPAQQLDVAGNIRLTGNLVSPNDICIGTC